MSAPTYPIPAQTLDQVLAEIAMCECPDCEGHGGFWHRVVAADALAGGFRVGEEFEECEVCGGTGEIPVEEGYVLDEHGDWVRP